MINIFTDGASRGNPGEAGIGVVIFENKEIKEEIKEYLGKKTNNEAEYLAVIKGLEYLEENNINQANFYLDSEFVSKQLKGEYKVKSEKMLTLYEKAISLSKNKKINFIWIPRSENKRADELANQSIDESKEDINLRLNKAFFGKINCFKVQISSDNQIYFHLGLKKGDWMWKKVKMSDIEIGEIITILNKEDAKCSFFHKFQDSNTQIWCNKDSKGFNIKVDNISKNLSIGELEVLKIILIESIKIVNFK